MLHDILFIVCKYYIDLYIIMNSTNGGVLSIPLLEVPT